MYLLRVISKSKFVNSLIVPKQQGGQNFLGLFQGRSFNQNLKGNLKPQQAQNFLLFKNYNQLPKNGGNYQRSYSSLFSKNIRSNHLLTKSSNPNYHEALFRNLISKGKPSGSITNIFSKTISLGLFFAFFQKISAHAEEKTEEKEKEEEEETQKKQEIPTYDYILIGGGTASFVALQEIKLNDPKAKILIISSENSSPYQRPPLSKELWKSRDQKALQNLEFFNFEGKVDKVVYPSEGLDGVDTLWNTSVMDMDIDNKAILLDDERIIKYSKSALIATGSRPNSLPKGVISESATNSGNITDFRTISDFKDLYEKSKNIKHVVVIGGGFLGSELSCGLANASKIRNVDLKITQVFPESGVMATVFPAYLSDYVTERLQKELNLNIIPNKLVTSVDFQNNQLLIKLNDERSLNADQIILATGATPNSELAILANLEVDPTTKGIITNQNLEASSNVYVAGDVSNYYDPILGRRNVQHHDNAIFQGSVAGRNMSSQNGSKFRYLHQPMFWGDLNTFGYEAVGILDPSLETVGIWELSDDPEENEKNPFRRGVIYYLRDDKRVSGILLWNVWDSVKDATLTIKKARRYLNPEDLKTEVSLEEKY